MGGKNICVKKVLQSIWIWHHSPVCVIDGNWNNPQSYGNYLWEDGVWLGKSCRVPVFGKKNTVRQHHSSFQNNLEINPQSVYVKKTTEGWIKAKYFYFFKDNLCWRILIAFFFFWQNSRPGGLGKNPIDTRYDLRSGHYLLNTVLSNSET